ncbi:MAG: amidohydrolase family protein [Clostridia bacterium]|nr:amidohydrolase family protein [Clostridia bacterium]
MLIDFHTHAFPEKIASKAIEKLSYASGGLTPYTNGTFFDLKRLFRESAIDKAVVLSIATNATQQKNVNDFAASINNSQNIFAFGSVFPDAPDALEELERIKALGLKGVKLHPDYQGFSVDDEKMKPIYKKIGELGLITIFHAGQDYGFPPPYGATPEKLEKALNWFQSPVIAAHFGGVGCGEQVLERLCGKDIYFDTSFGYGTLPKYYAQKIIDTHGADKILFGTDTPWHTAEMEMKLLNSLEITHADWEKVTHQNAEKLLGI